MAVCPLVASRSCSIIHILPSMFIPFHSFASPLPALTIDQINLFRKIELDAQYNKRMCVSVFVLEVESGTEKRRARE